MAKYEGPVIVALGLYLGIRESDGKALWQTTPTRQLAYSPEIAPYFELFSGAAPREELESLARGLERGRGSIDALIKQGLLMEVPDGFEAALDALEGKALYPRAKPVSAVDGTDERGWPIHDVTLRPPDDDTEVPITFPLSRVLEDVEHDLPGAISAVATSAGIPVQDLFARFMDQLDYAIGEGVVLVADVDADDGRAE